MPLTPLPLTLPLSLSYDHRVIDGARGAQFLLLGRHRAAIRAYEEYQKRGGKDERVEKWLSELRANR